MPKRKSRQMGLHWWEGFKPASDLERGRAEDDAGAGDAGEVGQGEGRTE